MSSLKGKLNSVMFLWIGFGLAIVTMIMIAIPAIEIPILGIKNSAEIFWDQSPGMKGNWPLFVGYLAILLGGLMMGFTALSFVQPSALVEKIILIAAGVLFVLGIVLLASFKEIYMSMNDITGTAQKLVDAHPGPYIGAGLAGGALVADAVALALDW